MDGKPPERLMIPDAESGNAHRLTVQLMAGLNLSMGKDATSRLGEFNVRHSSSHLMHTLIFSVKDRPAGGITFWLDDAGAGVAAVSILALHGAGGAPRLPQPAVAYLESIRRIARKHHEASFMKGPGARKNPPQQARMR
ncbi:MAG: hypothetical protein WC263_03065 [Candidatus Micrarchaeia archaeon]|jgi:hypothetical protein